jgi:hypothetical protein
MNTFAQYQRDKLQEARRLLAARGELNARGEWRRPTRTTADARRRLAKIRAEGTVDRRARLAALVAELGPPPAPPDAVPFAAIVASMHWGGGPLIVRREDPPHRPQRGG